MKKILSVLCLSFLLTGCATVVNFYKDIQVPEVKEEPKKEEKTIPEDKKEEKKEEVVQEDTTVYECTVEEFLASPENYDGKLVKVSGFLPAAEFADVNGNIVYGVCTEDGNSYAEITGVQPEFTYCKAWVLGKGVIVEGEITIEATGYELIEQYYAEPVQEFIQ